MAKVERIRLDKEGNQIKKPTRYFSTRQERQVAREVRGKVTSNSGAGLFEKGDVLTDKILFECKTKTSKSESIVIKKEWFEKNKIERVRQGKEYSVVVFNFGPQEENYYIVSSELFGYLKELLDK